MTRSISESVDSLAGDTPSEYQKGARSARDFLRAVFTRAAAVNQPATSAANTPENPDQQR